MRDDAENRESLRIISEEAAKILERGGVKTTWLGVEEFNFTLEKYQIQGVYHTKVPLSTSVTGILSFKFYGYKIEP